MPLLSFRREMVSTRGDFIKVKYSHYHTAKEDINSALSILLTIFSQDMNKQITHKPITKKETKHDNLVHLLTSVIHNKNFTIYMYFDSNDV